MAAAWRKKSAPSCGRRSSATKATQKAWARALPIGLPVLASRKVNSLALKASGRAPSNSTNDRSRYRCRVGSDAAEPRHATRKLVRYVPVRVDVADRGDGLRAPLRRGGSAGGATA